MVFVEIYAKNVTFGHLNPILGKLGVTHDLGWWLVEKPMVDFIFALVELFRCLLRFRSYEAKCVQLGCFLFALKFYPDRVVPQQLFLASEN